MRRLRTIVAAACAAVTALPAAATAQEATLPELALMGTIPIYWGEADGFGDLLSRTGETHWARPVIEREFSLAPLDYLSTQALAAHRNLLLAQPRALSPEENVALDHWVRAGGKLLLFIDPMMTGATRFALGDRRRPQDVAMLSPIMAHWGLELQIDEQQERGVHLADALGQIIPVNLPGTLALAGAGAGDCQIEPHSLAATCAVGLGQVAIVADAAILDFYGPYPQAEAGLVQLLARIFTETRDNAGNAGQVAREEPENGGNARFSAHVSNAVNAHDPP